MECLSYHCVSPQRTLRWLLFSLLAFLVPLLVVAQSDSRTTTNLPIIDMHFHTMWEGPSINEALTGFVSPKTPDELRRLNITALNRYHIVKVVASGDQISSYEQDLGEKLIPGILFPTEVFGKRPVSPAVLRQMRKQGKLAVLAEFGPQYLGLEPASPQLEQYWALAEELDMPVGIHMGLGPPGAA